MGTYTSKSNEYSSFNTQIVTLPYDNTLEISRTRNHEVFKVNVLDDYHHNE